jgi:hypothetical protein
VAGKQEADGLLSHLVDHSALLGFRLRQHDGPAREFDSSKDGQRKLEPSLAVPKLREGFSPLFLSSEKRENSLSREPRT